MKIKDAFAEHCHCYYSTWSDSLIKIESLAQVVFVLDCKGVDSCSVTGFHKRSDNVFYYDCDSTDLPDSIATYVIKTSEWNGRAPYQGNALADTTLWDSTDVVIARVVLRRKNEF